MEYTQGNIRIQNVLYMVHPPTACIYKSCITGHWFSLGVTILVPRLFKKIEKLYTHTPIQADV